MTKKGGLNRGLGAFIEDKNKVDEILNPTENISIRELDMNLIRRNKNQPRKDFDEESLGELAKSIEEHGVIQPIIVKEDGGYFEIIAGERRYRASQLANKKTIPAIVKNLTEYEEASIALIENVQREDLNPYEEATAYKNILDKYGLKQDELAKAVGKSRPYISNTIRLLKLDERVLEMLKSGEISYSMGRELLSIEDNDAQYKKALDVVKNKTSIKDISTQKKSRKKTVNSKKDIYLSDVEESFREVLGTNVNIDDRKKIISINYYDNEDLQRIIEIIVGE